MAELSKISTRQERLFDIYIDGGIDKAQYESKMNDMRSKQVDIEQRIANIGTASDEFYENIQRIMDIAHQAPLTLLGSKIEKRRELLNIVFSNLTLFDNQLRWEYKKTVRYYASNGFKSNLAPLYAEIRTYFEQNG